MKHVQRVELGILKVMQGDADALRTKADSLERERQRRYQEMVEAVRNGASVGDSVLDSLLREKDWDSVLAYLRKDR